MPDEFTVTAFVVTPFGKIEGLIEWRGWCGGGFSLSYVMWVFRDAEFAEVER